MTYRNFLSIASIVAFLFALDFMIESPLSKLTPDTQAAFDETLAGLELIGQTPDKVYTIYRIP